MKSAARDAYELSELEDLVPVRLVRTSEIFQRIADLVFRDRFGLRVTDLRILNVIHADEDVSVGEISRRARVDKAWISRLVRELELKRLVLRRADSNDGRSTLVSLTDRGRALQQEILPLARSHEVRTLGGVDRQAFVAMLDLFERNSLALLAALEKPPR